MTIREELVLPRMRRIHQKFAVPPAVDVADELNGQWRRIISKVDIVRGARVAVCVGSRAIAGLVEVVRGVVGNLRAAGGEPFIAPAMGSHGGATREGQIKILSLLGITEASVGAPIQATMEVVSMGAIDGLPLFLDKACHDADGIVLINRIKPHTDFSGPTESGLIKMLAIGLGNQIGADYYHRAAVSTGLYEIVSQAGRELLKSAHVKFGVALVENQQHQISALRMVTADELEAVEIELLQKARAWMPMLPLEEIDLLIIDEMGKDISGGGIDPNVVGRSSCAWGSKRVSPRIARIFVRDLSAASAGNASGLGMVDFTTRRLVEKIDMPATVMNALTSCCPEDAKIPLNYATDREAVQAALTTIRPHCAEDVKIVHIRNTLDLKKLLVSRGCLAELEGKPEIQIEPTDMPLAFDSSGNLAALI